MTVNNKDNIQNNILLTNGELCEKISAHNKGYQHWAFSVFLFDKQNRLLLQKRAKNKYHSGGLWTNTCCSHFCNEKELIDWQSTAKRRIEHELGYKYNGHLTKIKEFEYKAKVQTNDNKIMLENEIDFILFGEITSLKDIDVNKLNQNEVENIKMIDLKTLKQDLINNPNEYTEWLKLIIKAKII